MNVTDKIWMTTRTGTKMHGFLEGVALCRSSVLQDPGLTRTPIDHCEAQAGYNLCTGCVIKFEAAIEAAEAETVTEVTETITEAPAEAEQVTNHPDAGTYNPMDGADYLKVQGLYVAAEVHTDGTYAVFAQSQRIHRGRLNGTEGPLMQFFTNIARLWSARIDDERAQEAARRAEVEYAHHAEAEPAARVKTPEEVITIIEALGGRFRLLDLPSGRETVIHAHVLNTLLENAPQYGFKVEMRDNPEGHEYPWHVALINRHGQKRSEYHYMGR